SIDARALEAFDFVDWSPQTRETERDKERDERRDASEKQKGLKGGNKEWKNGVGRPAADVERIGNRVRIPLHEITNSRADGSQREYHHRQRWPAQLVGRLIAGHWEWEERLEVPVPARGQVIEGAPRQLRVVKFREQSAVPGDEILTHASPRLVRNRSARSSLTAAIGRKRRNSRNRSAKKAM